MRPVQLFCDSTADIPVEEMKRLQVKMIPLEVIVHGKAYRDLVDLDWKGLHPLIEQYNEIPKTSAINRMTYEMAFAPYLEQGYDIVVLCLGSHFSSTFEHASLVEQAHPSRVYALDSLNLSSAQGLLVYEMARLRDEGKSAGEIASTLKQEIPLAVTETSMETMEYLHKGGRCSGLKLKLSNLLKLYPIVKVKDGILRVYKIARGKFVNALKVQLEDFKAELKKGNVVLHNIIVSTVGNYEAQSYLYNEITKLVDPAIVHRFDAGCVVGAHCGPGTTGLFYLKKA